MSEQRPKTEQELIQLIRSIEEPAPAGLHARVREMAAGQERSGRSGAGVLIARGGLPRAWRLGSAATAAAAIAAALVLALVGGSGGPTLGEASALTLRSPRMPAPAESRSARSRLLASVDGIPFPYWEERFGWKASGERVDSLDGRTIRTVFYSDRRGRRIGYAIVAGTPAPGIDAGAVRWRNGGRYRLTSEHGAPVITWFRDGRLCIVSGRGVDAQTLLALASWGDHGSLS